jgi:hypothetical protein
VYEKKLRGLRGTANATAWEWDSWEWTYVMVYRLEDHHLVILHTEVRTRPSDRLACTVT